MKKYILDLTVRSVEPIHERYVLLRLTDPERPLPPMLPGQFVEVRIDNSPTTFLRRPISINFVDRERNELWLLVAAVGDGTRRLAALKGERKGESGETIPGDTLNCVLPLGNGFSLPQPLPRRGDNDAPAASSLGGGELLLVGGGVGVAPLLYFGAELKRMGCEPTFLLGARTSNDLLMLDEFRKYGRVLTTTEDGTAGERGFVTNHSVWQREHFTHIATCGPKPMMVAVARMAERLGIDCEASLENMMACGLGACLCCVEKTVEGNVCVCKEGPVFNTKKLTWSVGVSE
ncbi:MAG: dihydroorotate dehydrogenase electron transfer subunit [Prevotella sp.]|nr:dihydroorotate dehydrogenase electron transfer subunit [Prevotella sp.]